MKKIILLLISLTLATSCLRREDRHEMRTAYGAAIIYEGTADALAYNEFILAAVEMDIIAEAATIEEREKLADKFFPRFKFRTDGNKHILSRDNVVYFEITTDEQSLATPGAVWTVTKYNEPNRKQQPITITCLTPHSWDLQITKTEQNTPIEFQSTLESKRVEINHSPRNYTCLTTFDNAKIIDNFRKVRHTINTSDPLVIKYFIDRYYEQTEYFYGYFPHHTNYEISAGEMSDQFQNPVTDKTESVEALFTPAIESYTAPEVEIDYSSFTDIWYWPAIPDYNLYYFFY